MRSYAKTLANVKMGVVLFAESDIVLGMNFVNLHVAGNDCQNVRVLRAMCENLQLCSCLGINCQQHVETSMCKQEMLVICSYY